MLPTQKPALSSERKHHYTILISREDAKAVSNHCPLMPKEAMYIHLQLY
jgi:hypothetical protein